MNFIRGMRGFCLGAAVLLVVPAILLAQISGGKIIGSVDDESGGVLPGVQVSILNLGTGLTREATTSERGRYEVRGLPSGQYEVRAELSGFRGYAQTDVDVLVNRETVVNITLSIGAVTETVTVTGESVIIQVTTSSIGKVVEDDVMVAIPLANRNFVNLALLIPGVTTRTQSTTAGSTFYVHGQRDDANNFLLDGVSAVDLEGNRSAVRPNPDAVQEFNIQTSQFSAEFGRNAGSIIQVVTKSGTNEFGGNAWYFARDDSFQAQNFFAQNEPPPLSRKQYGGTFGGPIVHDKFFVFGSYEGIRENRGLTRQTVVTTARERIGNLSFLDTPIIDPETGQQFPGNIIPRDRIDPAATALFELMPLPNISGAGTRENNYVSSPIQTSDSDQILARADYYINTDNTMFYRHFWQSSPTFRPFQGAGVSHYEGFTNPRTAAVTHGTFGLNTVVSTTMFNELRTGIYMRSTTNVNLPLLNPLDFGVGYDRPQDTVGGVGLPEFNITGQAGIGNQIQGPSTTDDYEFQLTDVLTWEKGRHFLKFGGELRKAREEIDIGFFFVGRFVFDGGFTGDSLADFLLGRAREFNFSGGRTLLHQQNYNVGLFFQDDFHVTDNLVINLGIRYDYYAPITEDKGETSTFVVYQEPTFNVPNSGRAEIILAGDEAFGFPPKGTYFPDYNNIQPRVGFSWDTRGDGTLAVRGGFGVFHNQLKNNTTLQQLLAYPFFFQPVIRDTTLADPLKGLAREDYAMAPLDPGPPYDGLPIGQLYVTDPDIITPYTVSWTVGVQWEIARNTVLESAYVGNIGRELLQFREMNQPYNELSGINQTNKDSFRRHPGFTSVLRTTNWGESNYKGWETSLFRRFRDGLGFGVAYTLSRSEDLSSHFHSGATNRTWVMTPQDDDDHEAERSDSFFDARQRLVLSEIWTLPYSPGGALGAVLGDWSINSVWTVQSGRPYSPYDSGDPCLTAGNWTPVCRPNLVGDPNAGPKTSDEWFNTGAFERTGQGEFGSAPRNALLGPSLKNVDVSFDKFFPFGDRANIQLRFEVYNLLNTANLGIPTVDIASSAFGRIGRTATPAREFQFGIKVAF
jgi:hypothetical protein